MDSPGTSVDPWAQWQDWSLQEGDAIAAGNWPAVERCQQAKREIQQAVSAATSLRTQSASGSGEANMAPQRLRDLIALEHRNLEVLASKRRQLEAEHEQVESSARNLRLLRGSYVRQSAAQWQSYS